MIGMPDHRESGRNINISQPKTFFISGSEQPAGVDGDVVPREKFKT